MLLLKEFPRVGKKISLAMLLLSSTVSAASAIPISGTEVELDISAFLEVGLRGDSRTRSATSANTDIRISRARIPTFVDFGRVVVPNIDETTLSYFFTLDRTETTTLFVPEQVPMLVSQSGGVSIRLTGEIPFDSSQFFGGGGGSSFSPARTEEELLTIPTIPPQRLSVTNTRTESFGSLSPADGTDFTLRAFLTSEPFIAIPGDRLFNQERRLDVSLQLNGTATFAVDSERADMAAKRAQSSLETNERLRRIFSGPIDAVISAVTLRGDIRNVVDASRSGGSGAAAASALSLGDNARDLALIGQDDDRGFEVGTPGAVTTARDQVEAEIRSIVTNPLNAADWFAGTRSLEFMVTVGEDQARAALNDPPRFDYDLLYLPEDVSLSAEIAALLSEAEVRSINLYLRSLELSNVIYVANERFQGAMIDGDSSAQEAQAQIIFEASQALEALVPDVESSFETYTVELASRMVADLNSTDVPRVLSDLREASDIVAGLLSEGLIDGEQAAALQILFQTMQVELAVPLDDFVSLFDDFEFITPYTLPGENGSVLPPADISAVPLPASALLLLTGLLGVVGLKGRKTASQKNS